MTANHFVDPGDDDLSKRLRFVWDTGRGSPGVVSENVEFRVALALKQRAEIAVFQCDAELSAVVNDERREATMNLPDVKVQLDSAKVLAEQAVASLGQLAADPLVHLRIKQLRVVTISLVAGVNISVSLAGEPQQDLRSFEAAHEQRATEMPARTRTDNELITLLVEAIWPRILARLQNRDESEVRSGSYSPNKPYRGRTSRRSSPQQKLPLKE